MGQPRQMSKELYEKLKKGFEKPLKVKTKVKAPSGIQTMTMKALKKRFDAEMANRDNEKRRQEAKGVKPSGFPMYKGGGSIDAALRAQLKKNTSKAKPKVSIKDTPMERINNTNVRQDTYKEVSDDIVKNTNTPRMKANQYALATLDMTTAGNVKKTGKEAGAKTYGQLADAVEKKYKFGGKIYKDGGLALFKALKKKFGEG
jgi:hypothetical protein